MNKNFLAMITLLIFALSLTACGKSAVDQSGSVVQDMEDQIIGGQTDEHDCLAPAGYSWCEAKEKCMRHWEENCGSAELDMAFDYLKELRAIAIAKNFETDYIGEGELSWKSNGSEIVYPAKKLVVKRLAEGDEIILTDFFSVQFFEMDNNNSFNSTNGGFIGFRKADIICSALRNQNPELPLDDAGTPSITAEIQCTNLQFVK